MVKNLSAYLMIGSMATAIIAGYVNLQYKTEQNIGAVSELRADAREIISIKQDVELIKYGQAYIDDRIKNIDFRLGKIFDLMLESAGKTKNHGD